MHAITFQGVDQLAYSEVADPQITAPTDVVVKITMAGICGSDLHPYHGREKGLDIGTVMGHEFVGIVEEVGSAIKKFKKGDRIFSSFSTSCGVCFYCQHGLSSRCIHGQLFGWVRDGKGLHGGQAEYIRVPLADTTMFHLSNDLTEKKGLLLGDVFSTGYFCADNAHIQPGSTSVVIGCGPVGLMAIVAAKYMHTQHLFAVDLITERLVMAEDFGAIPINAKQENVKDYVLRVTEGRGADVVMEVVGGATTLRLAYDLIRPGGTISSVGVHTSPTFPFSPSDGYDKNITYNNGRCPAHYYADKLLKEQIPQKLPIEKIITHEFPLAEGVEAYRIFDKKRDHCIKAVLRP